MTGLYLSTLDSLATLAMAIGRNGTAATLRVRHDAMAKVSASRPFYFLFSIFYSLSCEPALTI